MAHICKINLYATDQPIESSFCKDTQLGRTDSICRPSSKGMIITFSHIFRKKATVRYPEQKRPIAGVYRGLHVLKRDEQGRENCTACGLCAVACPAEAITMEAAERHKGEEHLYREEKYAADVRDQYAALHFLRTVRRSMSKRCHLPD